MYEPLYFKHDDTYKVFFTSDLHYSHNKEFIFGPRGFPLIEKHDEAIIRRWNDAVSENDTVFMLGDMIFGKDADLRLLDLFKILKFKELLLLPGNHHAGVRQIYYQCKDKIFGLPKEVNCYPLRVDLRRMFGDLFPENKTVVFVPNLIEIYVNKQPIVLSHYPLISWNGMGHGSFHLFGHVHGRIEQGLKDKNGFGKMLDVGIESIAAPISFDKINEIMENKPFSKVDHHGPETKNPF